MKVKVGAKVNLSLAVTGKKNGLHTLDMRVATVSVFDSAEALGGRGEKFEFGRTVSGFDAARFLPVLERTYSRLRARFGGDMRFRFEKGIPSGAGLGGSSALPVAMAALWAAEKGETPDESLLLSLGSDVPYMYTGGDARVTGTGERVEKLPFLPRTVVIAIPGCEVDTAAAYALYDALAARGDAVHDCSNDLYLPACRLAPEVADACALLADRGAERVVMSGSGSAVCAFFGAGESARAEDVFFAVRGKMRCILAETLPQSLFWEG